MRVATGGTGAGSGTVGLIGVLGDDGTGSIGQGNGAAQMFGSHIVFGGPIGAGDKAVDAQAGKAPMPIAGIFLRLGYCTCNRLDGTFKQDAERARCFKIFLLSWPIAAS